MKHIDQRVSQNIKNIIGEIGELHCVFQLYSRFSRRGWSVYRNIDEGGYDILLSKGGRKIRIEVKTRQRLVSSASNRTQSAYFPPSLIECKKADFLIAYWVEKNLFYIVPMKEVLKMPRHRFIVKLDKNDKPNKNPATDKDWNTIIK